MREIRIITCIYNTNNDSWVISSTSILSPFLTEFREGLLNLIFWREQNFRWEFLDGEVFPGQLSVSDLFLLVGRHNEVKGHGEHVGVFVWRVQLVQLVPGRCKSRRDLERCWVKIMGVKMYKTTKIWSLSLFSFLESICLTKPWSKDTLKKESYIFHSFLTFQHRGI